MRTIGIAALSLSGLCCQLSMAEESTSAFRQHEAHEHGTAVLNVVVEGQQLQIELISPAMNIIGFEHAPETDEQRQVLDQALSVLGDATQLFTPTAAADCTLSKAEVDKVALAEHDDHHDDHKEHAKSEAHDDHHHDDDHKEHAKSEAHDDHDEHGDEAHADFHASYAYSCAQPERLEYLDVKLFEHFGATETILTQVIGPAGQSAGELSADSVRLTF